MLNKEIEADLEALEELNYVGKKTAMNLYDAGLRSVREVADAPMLTLTSIKWLGYTKAADIKRSAQEQFDHRCANCGVTLEEAPDPASVRCLHHSEDWEEYCEACFFQSPDHGGYERPGDKIIGDQIREKCEERQQEQVTDGGEDHDEAVNPQGEGGEDGLPDGDYGHKGPLIERELNTRHHDGEKTLMCKTCHVMVPIDEPEELENHDCEHYEKIRKGITGSTNDLMTDGGQVIEADFDGFTSALYAHDKVQGYAGSEATNRITAGLAGKYEKDPPWLLHMARSYGFEPLLNDLLHGEYDPYADATDFCFKGNKSHAAIRNQRVMTDGGEDIDWDEEDRYQEARAELRSHAYVNGETVELVRSKEGEPLYIRFTMSYPNTAPLSRKLKELGMHLRYVEANEGPRPDGRDAPWLKVTVNFTEVSKDEY